MFNLRASFSLLCHAGVTRRLDVVGLALVALLSGCGKAGAPAPPPLRDTTTVMLPRIVSSGDPSCPRDGLWKACALIDRVVHAGLFFEATGDSVSIPYLGPRGVRFRVGKSAELLAFFYADSASAARDLSTLDTARLTPVGDTLGAWPSRPSVIRSSNLVVALFGSDGRQVERVTLAITAGAPQPFAVPTLPSVPAR